MRVLITKLMDKGLKRPQRAPPIPGELQYDLDDRGVRSLVLCTLERSDIPEIARLLHPQLSDVAAKTMTMLGYEHDAATGQVFGQAWEIEPTRR